MRKMTNTEPAPAKKKLGRRERLLLSLFSHGAALTDREAAERLNASRDFTQPTISRMLRAGLLVPAGHTHCRTTHKLVRLSTARDS